MQRDSNTAGCLVLCITKQKSLCLLNNHLMSHTKVLTNVVNFDTRDHTQQDVAIRTVVRVSMRTLLPCLLCEQHTLQRLVGCCLPAVGGKDLGNCRAVSHSLRTAESAIYKSTEYRLMPSACRLIVRAKL